LTYENFKTAFRIISNLAITSTEKRLADRLIMEAETRGDGDGWIPISQPELAKLLAVSVPTLQRIMRRFVSAGLVRNSYARIQVVDRDALIRLCRR
jgi:CRP/FNR family cyclic AMP-dependent transcriptional regulator